MFNSNHFNPINFNVNSLSGGHFGSNNFNPTNFPSTPNSSVLSTPNFGSTSNFNGTFDSKHLNAPANNSISINSISSTKPLRRVDSNYDVKKRFSINDPYLAYSNDLTISQKHLYPKYDPNRVQNSAHGEYLLSQQQIHFFTVDFETSNYLSL